MMLSSVTIYLTFLILFGIFRIFSSRGGSFYHRVFSY